MCVRCGICSVYKQVFVDVYEFRADCLIFTAVDTTKYNMLKIPNNIRAFVLGKLLHMHMQMCFR